MEIFLAIVVAMAVIFFGALISIGNERQRKAIDNLRAQTVLWAVQDLRIKREKLAREVHVDDPLGWFNQIASRVCGQQLNFQSIETFQDPLVLVCANKDSAIKILFTLLSPADLHALRKGKHSVLSRYANQNPILSMTNRVKSFECSMLNCGILFDVELPLAWKALTGKDCSEISSIWLYVLPQP